MMARGDIEDRARKLMERLRREAEASGYHLNPDEDMTLDLCKGLVSNIDRYGYMACPCRLADGIKENDLDIICPCDYRDADITEFGACYCALYVNEAIYKGEATAQSIPERRPPPEERRKKQQAQLLKVEGNTLAVWRCRVCGYLCARESPPEVCPICKAKKDRFEQFLWKG